MASEVLPRPSRALSRKHVSRRGIGIALLDLAKLFEGAVEFFCPQTALRKHLPQLNIVWIGLRRQLKVLRGFRKPLRPVVAQAEQRARLHIVRLGGQSGVERGDGCLKVPLLEFRQPEIQLDSRELGIQCERLPVGRGRLLIFLLFGEVHPQAGERSGIARVLLDHCLPDLDRFVQFPLLFERDGFRGARDCANAEPAHRSAAVTRNTSRGFGSCLVNILSPSPLFSRNCAF